MYEIEFTPEAIEDLKPFRKFEQQTIISGIDTRLKYEPTVETHNRFQMRSNDVAEWELRIGKGLMLEIVMTLSKKSRQRQKIRRCWHFWQNAGVMENESR